MVRHNDRWSDELRAGSNLRDDNRPAADGESPSAPPPPARIAVLLRPYLERPLAADILQKISAYIALLQKWNAVINLTAVREPELMVTRHFGESFFAAARLLGDDPHLPTDAPIIDFGSGAGFPGMPFALYAPRLEVQLIESRNKKATFLKEVIRELGLENVHVVEARGEDYSAAAALVTMRAVEDFERSLPAAAALVGPGGRLALLVGDRQLSSCRRLLPQFEWKPPVPVPGGLARVLAVAARAA